MEKTVNKLISILKSDEMQRQFCRAIGSTLKDCLNQAEVKSSLGCLRSFLGESDTWPIFERISWDKMGKKKYKIGFHNEEAAPVKSQKHTVSSRLCYLHMK